MVAIAFAVFGLALPRQVQTDWKAAALEDVEAAHAILLGNHPGAAPEAADAAFVQRLERGRTAALGQAETVNRYEDYVAVMRTFTASVEDPHVMWGPSGALQLRTPPEPGPRRGNAGFGVSRQDQTLWIGLSSLDSRAEPVIRSLAENRDPLAQASRIVVDLRGNAGGDEGRGQRLAALIFGQDAMVAARRRAPAGCPDSAWRVSRGAVRRLEAAGQTEQLNLVRIALLAGRNFDRRLPPACLSAALEPVAASASRGRVVVITDGGCMSSCPGVVDLFRRLGAVHVGHATKPRLRYMEADVEPLPSGRGVIQVVRRLAFFWPARTEPIEPARRFDGDIADSDAVRTWVASLPL